MMRLFLQNSLTFKFLVILMLLSIKLRSANEHLITSKTGNQIVAGQVLTLQDQWFGYMDVNGTNNSQFRVNQAYAGVSLRFDQTKLNNFQTSWNLSVGYSAQLYDQDNILLSTQTGTLSINYDNANSFKDRDFVKFSGNYFKIKVTIGTVSLNGSSTIASTFLNDIFFDVEQETERYYKFTASPNPTLVSSGTVANNELPISWKYLQGAESYDLEWVFIDLGNRSFASNYDFDFRNATRINTRNQYYKIPLGYPRGIIIYRVRGVGYDSQNNLRTESDWSYNNGSLAGNTVNVPSNPQMAYRYDFSGLNLDMNWQYSATYAEDGKRKEVISYFDGSLRNRQTVTKLNSDNSIVLAETKYDFEGRGAVQMLPTPLSTNTGIHYYTNFNDNFNKNDFDTDVTFNNPNSVIPSTNKTGEYYSSNSSSTGLDALTPDAEGYPYSRTKYLRDGSNRISSQSGVGVKFKSNNSSHETHYFYGTPTGQQELDRLFGNEVGNWMHYQKNFVVDPNGQASVTYLDQEGRTIATALSGNAPSSLLEIDGKPSAFSLTSDILTGKNNLMDNALVSQNTFTVTSPNSTFSFDYDLLNDSHCENCNETPICKTCKYDLVFTVKDEFNQPVTFSITPETYEDGVAVFSNITTGDYSFDVVFPNIGTYTVIKTLKLNEASLSQYYNELVSSFYDCLPFTPVDPEPCLDCQGICEKTYRVPDGAGFDYFDENGQPITEEQGLVLIAECKALCENPTEAKDDCLLKLSLLKADMSPGGQYFDNYYLNLPAGGFNTSNKNAWLVSHIGSATPTNSTTDYGAFMDWINSTPSNVNCYFPASVTENWTSWDSVRSNWRDCFADYLIQFHPEYCHYDYNCLRTLCGDFKIDDSNDFDRDMISEFASHKYFNPTNVAHQVSSPTAYFDSTSLPSQIFDPFFNASTYSSCSGIDTIKYNNCSGGGKTSMLFRDAINERLNYYMLSGTTWVSLWYIIDDPADIYNKSSLAAASAAAGFSVSNSLFQTIRNLHGDGTSSNYGLLGGTSPQMTKYQYFTNQYLGIKKLIQQQKGNYDLAVIKCDYLESSETNWGWTNQTNSFQIRYIQNGMYDAVIGAACYSGSLPHVTYNSGLVTGIQDIYDGGAGATSGVIQEAYAGNCSQFVDGWLSHIFANCSGLQTALTTSELAAMKQHLINVCASDANVHYAMGGDGTRVTGNLVSGFDDFQDVVDYYASLHSLSCSTAAPSHPSQSIINQQVDCINGAYTQFINDAVNCPACTTATAKAAAINSFFGTSSVTASNVTAWESEFSATNHSLSVLLSNNFPDSWICPASNVQDYSVYSCNCTNLNNYISGLGGTPTDSDIATAMNDDFSLTLTSTDVAGWKTACTNQTFTGSTFNAFPATLKCPSKEECTANVFISFVINRGIPPYNFPPPYDNLSTLTQHTYTGTELTAIANALNDAFDPDVAVTSTHVSSWFTAYFSKSYSASTFDNLPEELHCSDDALPPPSCACELENLQAYEDATYINEQNKLLAAQQAALAFIENYKAECLNTIARESFFVTYTLNEYYYTLYYYDQAGNLVKTVPPNGVAPLTTSTEFTNVQNYRSGVGGSIFTIPTHKMITHYWYNSLQQLIKQYTPDADSSWFYYDQLGRLVVSQNAKQKINNNYSYTLYDVLGRITEVGEIYSTTAMTDAIARGKTSPTLSTWLAGGSESQITKTFYDETAAGVPTDVANIQENLRNRVSTTSYDNDGNGTYDHATHYSYDIHGNVKTLVQENTHLIDLEQDLKYIDYEYDLVSGKVNKVLYQNRTTSEGYPQFDRFYHQYYYDSDNRITNVYTSRDNEIWEQDAKYYYYAHGPLARTELGEKKVQGVDLVYTLQGWIKGVNSNTLDNTLEPGHDAQQVSNLNKIVAGDAMAYTLKYFEGDYVAKKSSAGNFEAVTSSNTYLATQAPGLYNGNIAMMSTTILDPSNLTSPLPQINGYRYDQLNRIRSARSYTGITSNQWNNTADNLRYYEELHYDFNGNILLNRKHTSSGTRFDKLKYYYYNHDQTATYDLTNTAIPIPVDMSNKLAYVTDSAAVSGLLSTDIDDQSANNYDYDKIGNLIADVQEGIADIKWNVYGKISTITRATGNLKEDLTFAYDASGNRVEKIVKPKNSGTGVLKNEVDWRKVYYVRDAQGNIMATYERTYANSGGSNYNDVLALTEHDIYGSSRLGIRNGEATDKVTVTFTSSGFDATSKEFISPSYSSPSSPPPFNGAVQQFVRNIGKKQYELSNHLGNVLTVITDRKIARDDNSDGTIDYFQADVVQSQDYYATGMLMPGRIFSSSSSYRYGWNKGSEGDEEISGTGNMISTFFRENDVRLGRWWGVDPKPKASWSPYASMDCNPIWYNDPLGDVVDYGKIGQGGVKNFIKSGISRIFSSNYRTTFNAWKNSTNTYTLNEVNNMPSLKSGGQVTATSATTFNVNYSETGLHVEPKGVPVFGTKTVTRSDETAGSTNNNPTNQSVRAVVPGSNIVIHPLPHPDEFTFTDQSGGVVRQGTYVSAPNGTNYLNLPTFAPVTTLTPATGGGTINIVVPAGTTTINIGQRSTSPWPYIDSGGLLQNHTDSNSDWIVEITKYRVWIPSIR